MCKKTSDLVALHFTSWSVGLWADCVNQLITRKRKIDKAPLETAPLIADSLHALFAANMFQTKQSSNIHKRYKMVYRLS